MKQADLFLPAYRVRRSRRAKRLSLRVSPDLGIEVVLPQRMSERHVAPFVEQHRQWIEKTQRKQQGRLQQRKTLPDGQWLPEIITLPALDETWVLNFKPANGNQCRLTQKQTKILLSGPAHNRTRAHQRLQQWLKDRAKATLPGWLQQVSEQTGLEFSQARIRAQRTRWGSCSSRGNINLNYKLIFQPPEVVEYLFIHELCHTRHMNHSKRYWQLVAQHCPNYKRLDRQLVQGWQHVPLWVDRI